MMINLDIEEYHDDIEEKADDSSGQELECVECGKKGYPITDGIPFMCSECKSKWY